METNELATLIKHIRPCRFMIGHWFKLIHHHWGGWKWNEIISPHFWLGWRQKIKYFYSNRHSFRLCIIFTLEITRFSLCVCHVIYPITYYLLLQLFTAESQQSEEEVLYCAERRLSFPCCVGQTKCRIYETGNNWIMKEHPSISYNLGLSE